MDKDQKIAQWLTTVSTALGTLATIVLTYFAYAALYNVAIPKVELDDLKNRNATLENERSSLEQNISRLRGEGSQLGKERDNLKLSVDEARQQLEAINTRLSEGETLRQAMAKQIDYLTIQRDKLPEEVLQARNYLIESYLSLFADKVSQAALDVFRDGLSKYYKFMYSGLVVTIPDETFSSFGKCHFAEQDLDQMNGLTLVNCLMDADDFPWPQSVGIREEIKMLITKYVNQNRAKIDILLGMKPATTKDEYDRVFEVSNQNVHALGATMSVIPSFFKNGLLK